MISFCIECYEDGVSLNEEKLNEEKLCEACAVEKHINDRSSPNMSTYEIPYEGRS